MFLRVHFSLTLPSLYLMNCHRRYFSQDANQNCRVTLRSPKTKKIHPKINLNTLRSKENKFPLFILSSYVQLLTQHLIYTRERCSLNGVCIGSTLRRVSNGPGSIYRLIITNHPPHPLPAIFLSREEKGWKSKNINLNLDFKTRKCKNVQKRTSKRCTAHTGCPKKIYY